MSLSQGRRNCAFGRGKTPDKREKCTESLVCKQTAASEPGPHRAGEIRREPCPAMQEEHSAGYKAVN